MEFFAEITGFLILTAVSLRGALSAYGVAERRIAAVRTEQRQIKVLSARVDRRLDSEHERQRLTWSGTRKFQIVGRQYENATGSICSFYLVPGDNQPVPVFRPGQFLSFEVPLNGQMQPAIRCYSISSSPNERRFYRITVKRVGAPDCAPASVPPGMISNFFHDRLAPGSVLDVYAPSGSFSLNQNSERPIVLVAGCVGITPLISMLSWLVATHAKREIWLFYGVRNRAEHAMYDALKLLAKTCANFRTVTFYSRPSDTCREGVDYDVEGYVSVDVMKQVLKSSNYEFYVCGPSSMMETITRDLYACGVGNDDIKLEAFGAAPLANSEPGETAATAGHAKPHRVHFSRSNKTVRWTPSTKSLLELAEASGIKARFGCRSGNCGTCSSGIQDGKISYIRQPGVEPASGSCLICIARPQGDVVIDL